MNYLVWCLLMWGEFVEILLPRCIIRASMKALIANLAVLQLLLYVIILTELFLVYLIDIFDRFNSMILNFKFNE